ncbi:ribosome maturation factor RimP [Alkaliphilus hydrothermalis]|uniref:Ribosome maturation factor RimP n=1 Tax=Alkaliphilus hydrothermalis TaxID=1482730 RepID=A0ABS2NL89_9FIRM|nr:ribosome maturation factor RimP [Alkaliphilus hydrothermalis]MBM7613703.1 ribosome maturation factor RimP [Alkaliphilus hydrothermalis]
MGQNRVEKLIEELVLPIVEKEDFELVDVEYKKEGPHRYLRVFIDKTGGITLDDCQNVSMALSDKLDELDPIEENYFLEVSSPGLDRPLKKDSDFDKFKGEAVEVKLYEPLMGQKVIEGELVGLVDDKIQLNVKGAGVIEIPRDKAAMTRLAIKF